MSSGVAEKLETGLVRKYTVLDRIFPPHPTSAVCASANAIRMADPAARNIAVGRDHRPLWYRAFEVLASVGALVVFSPLMLAVAILIKLDSPGPVLFRQQRVAKGGELFTFLKFRTMMVDGNVRFPQFSPQALQREDTGELRLSVESDPRVTPFGRWLRRTSVDELPNFLNVLSGSMALVGPRPEMPEILPHYTDQQLAKFSIAPGITGYAQIYGRGDLSFLETVDYDLRYVCERTTLLDIQILFRTIAGVLARKGAF